MGEKIIKQNPVSPLDAKISAQNRVRVWKAFWGGRAEKKGRGFFWLICFPVWVFLYITTKAAETGRAEDRRARRITFLFSGLSVYIRQSLRLPHYSHTTRIAVAGLVTIVTYLPTITTARLGLGANRK